MATATAKAGYWESWMSRSLAAASDRLHPEYDWMLIDDLEKIARLTESQLGIQPWHPETEGSLDDLSMIETLEELDVSVQRIRRDLDLQHVTIVSVKESLGCIAKHRMLTTWPRSWVEEYIRERYQQVDPIFRESGFEEPLLLHDLAISTPIVADYLRKAERAGVGPSWLVCWTEVAAGTAIAVILTSDAHPAEFEARLERLGRDLCVISEALARTFARADGMIPKCYRQLSDEDLTLLRAIATGTWSSFTRGMPDPALSSPGAPALCQKLGVESLAQAAIAVAPTGFLAYAPLRMEEVWISKDRRRRRSRRRKSLEAA